MKQPAADKHDARSFYAYNYWAKLLIKTVLSGISLDAVTVEKIRGAEAKGVVVYAIKHPSSLDCLAVYELLKSARLPLPTYAHGINTSLFYSFSDLLRLFWGWLGRLFSPSALGEKTTVLLRRVENGRSALFHLGSVGGSRDRDTKSALRQLTLAAKGGREIIVVPLLVAYGRRREKEEENLLRIVLGQTEYSGALRRLITFVRYARRVIIMAGEALPLSQYLAAHDVPTSKLLSGLREELTAAIDKEKAAIIGPTLKSTKEIVNSVLEEPEFTRFVDVLSGGNEKRRASILKRARKQLKEIAADYDDIYISIMDLLLGWLWNNIYDGLVVDKAGLAKIRELAKQMPFIVIPCHRSHIDYLALSHVLYKNNLPLPFVAAGANMQFWPMGGIFRRCGAFFLRRSFQGNDLYRMVFSQYLRKLIEEGIPLEFFIEGGRSRTGKMVMPKYGLLSMVIQAFQEGRVNDLALIPVYLGYDRIVEEKSYLQELGGKEKQTEKATDIIKSGGILRKRFGQIYINIGEPITLRSYFSSLPSPFEELPEDDRRALYRKLGYEIALRISAVSVVTPFAMVAAALLSHDYRGISHEDLQDCVGYFANYLKFRGVRLAETLIHEDKAIKSTIQKFEEAKYIEKIMDDDEEDAVVIVYSLEEGKRLAIEYYKNNILHFFIPISFFALAVLQQDSNEARLSDVAADYAYLKRLFRHEFIFDDAVDDAAEIEFVSDFLRHYDMLEHVGDGEEARIVTRGFGMKVLERFAALTKNYVESYWVAVRSLSLLRKQPLPQKDFFRRLTLLGDMLYKKGEIRRAEALSHANYQNALRYLREQGLLREEERREKNDKKSTRYYSVVGEKAVLERVRREVFRFIR